MTTEDEFPTVISRPHGTMPCPPMLSFAGGDVPPPNPTRADLVLSAKQWAKAARDHFVDHYQNIGDDKNDHWHTDARMLSVLRHLDETLAELEVSS